VIHTLVVVSIPIEDSKKISFLVGFARSANCCPVEVSNEECIVEYVGAAPNKITSCWGDKQIQLAKLSLMFLYLLFTGAFGWLVGLIVLRETQFLEKKPGQASTKPDKTD
jgi:hypothetical protein